MDDKNRLPVLDDLSEDNIEFIDRMMKKEYQRQLRKKEEKEEKDNHGKE